MGIIQQKIVVSIANLTKNCKSSKKQVVMSCVSLLLATMILCSSVYCWLFLQQANTLGTFSINAGNGLRLNYNNNNSSVVQITDNMNFLPVSSVNGQNLYFPSDGSFFTKANIKEKTEEITYRSATAGDKNIFFLQFDFALTSYTNGTEVYIDDTDTYIKVKKSSAPLNAMRVAFLYDNGKNTVVMNPTTRDRITDAVDLVNFGTGECLKTKQQISRPFSYYTAANGESLFTLSEGETQKMSVVVWLEGTDRDCANKIIGSELDINIKFTTTANSTDEITFKDVSGNGWISNLLKNGAQLQLVYTDDLNNINTLEMNGSGSEYTCKIPKTVDSGISFKIIDGDDTYVWEREPDLESGAGGGPSTYRGKNVTYYAKGTTTDPRGYWKTSDTDNEIDTDTPVDEW